jgi:hypothetical protein
MKYLLPIFLQLFLVTSCYMGDPLIFSASNGESPDSVNLEWETYEDATLSSAQYILSRSIDDISYTPIFTTFANRSYEDKSVTPGILYYYRLEAFDELSNLIEVKYDTGYAMDIEQILPIDSAAEPITVNTGNTVSSYRWFELMGIKSIPIRIKTSSAGNDSFDTIIEIYNAYKDLTVLASDDNSGFNNFSSLEYTPQEDGLLWIKLSATTEESCKLSAELIP